MDAFVLAPAIAFVQLFQSYGVSITMEEARKPMGLRKDLHIKELLQNKKIQQGWQYVHKELPSKNMHEKMFPDFVTLQKKCLRNYTKLLPETASVVNILQNQMGLKIGSTTGFTQDLQDILIEEASKQGYNPDICIAGDDLLMDLGVRPKPFMLWENLFHLGMFPIQSVVKVDDTIGGLGEARSAGCWGVGIAAYSTYMNIDSFNQWDKMSETEKEKRLKHSRSKLKEHAHYVIDTLYELPNIIEDINNRMKLGHRP